LIATCGVVWVIVVCPATWEMLALPPLTTPPWGVATANPPQANITAKGNDRQAQTV
jgi:hypothetical protein